MRSRWALVEERGALSHLWARCFAEEEAVANAFFEQYPPQTHTRVITLDNQPIAMASWLSMDLVAAGEQYPAAYFYAVATHPKAQGQGLCRTLMAELEKSLMKQGIAFAALCPATPSLYDFYASMGYQTAFYCRWRTISAAKHEAAALEISPEDYRLLRDSLLSIPHCRWDSAAMRYLQRTGTRFFRLPDGFAAVCAQPDGTLRVPELLAQDELRAINSLCRTMGAATAYVRFHGTDTPQGMLKRLSGQQDLPPLDLGFAFD